LDSGYELEKLMQILNVSLTTIYNWKNNWSSQKLVGLYNKEGRGRKKIFDPEQQQQIKEWARKHRTNLKPVIEKIRKEWGIKASKDTVKRILKSLGMKWKRLRRIVGGSPEKEEYQSKKKILQALRKLASQGSIDLRYKSRNRILFNSLCTLRLARKKRDRWSK
jgi:transposase